MNGPHDTSNTGAPVPVPGGYGAGFGPEPDAPPAFHAPPGQPPFPGLAVTSLVCGLTGMPLAFCCCSVIAIPLAVVAFVTGAMALRRSTADPLGNHGRGMAIGGIGCAAIGVVFTLVLVFGHIEPNLLQRLFGF